MGHVELRPLDDDDIDAIFDMMRDPEAIARAAFTAEDSNDRPVFDLWLDDKRADPSVTLLVITESGGFAGTAAAFDVGGDREVSYWVARHAWGRGVGTEALRLLVSREAERPLFARVATDNAASIAVLERNGFTEVSRDISFAPGLGRDAEEIVFTLVPTLDGI